MSGLLINTTTGDLDITEGKLSLTTGLIAVAQRITQLLRLVRGEWFINTRRGVPWITQVLVKNPNPTTVNAVILNAILSEPQVLRMLEFTLDLDVATRVLTVTFRALTEFGELNFQEAFGI